jgi:hypothetical protein
MRFNQLTPGYDHTVIVVLEHITILAIHVTIIGLMNPARQRPYRGEIHGQKQL